MCKCRPQHVLVEAWQGYVALKAHPPISVLRRTVIRPEHNNLIRVDAGIKSASQKQSSERASGLEMWLTTLSRSVQGGSRFR
jgi:hypothetical protein